jgi:hypothetical protein
MFNLKGHVPMNAIAEDIGPGGVVLYIGNQLAASDDSLLKTHDITCVLNCAVNLDINYVDRTLDKSDGEDHRVFGHAPFRSAKVGMIDGPGNSPSHLISACHLIDAMLTQTMPEKESYPVKRAGNILVHCRGGRSRSVAVSALYLHLKYPGRWPTFEEALQYVREKRQIKPDDYHEAPKEDLLVLVRQVLNLRDSGAVVLI